MKKALLRDTFSLDVELPVASVNIGLLGRKLVLTTEVTEKLSSVQSTDR